MVIEDVFNFLIIIEVVLMGILLENIEQWVYLVFNYYIKFNLLIYLLVDEEIYIRVLVFVFSKCLVDVVYEIFELYFGEKVGVIYVNKSQNYCFECLCQFDLGEYCILIVIDLIFRGMDISDVFYVINIDMFDQVEDYIY